MDFRQCSDDDLWAIATPIMDNLMSASTELDHARHCRDFTQRMRSIVTQAHFASVCQAYQSEKGLFTARQPVALFRRPESVAFVWKQMFSIAEGEFVAEMVLVEQDGQYLVDHVMVF
ncbi:hypothetical protein EK599_08185 [Vibrio sp. T187]|uniref:hypothetical protein n=1 Tax=Vibrio TaxID=662 RepID=UPI0010CA04F4|nr:MULTISPECIES: hypothetical protein [Vibrio]MBW3695671.1 hypothetical protein [Vibrio sp. T187]